MNKVLTPFIFLIVISCSSKKSIEPRDYLTREQEREILWPVIHYAAKLPPGANRDTRFNQRFDDYYQNVILDYNFLHLSPNDDGSYFFLLERPARSITPMFESIGGKFKYEKDSLVEYEEIFRMWKMPDADLKKRGREMFVRMVKGSDLSIYYSKYAGDKYIEFPDDRFHFDKNKRRWVDASMDSLEFQ